MFEWIDFFDFGLTYSIYCASPFYTLNFNDHIGSLSVIL